MAACKPPRKGHLRSRRTAQIRYREREGLANRGAAVLDDLMGYLLTLPIKDWGGTIIGGLIALFGVLYTQWDKRRALREQRAIDADKLRRDEIEKAKIGDRNFDIAQTQDLTVRFKALMDGYEARIIDLSTELKGVKDENRELRAENTRLRDDNNAA